MTRRNLSPPLLAARWLLAQDTPDPSTRDAALKFGVDELRVIDHMESLRETGEPARDTSKPATLPRHSRKLRTSGKDAKRWQKKELVKLYRMRKRNIPWERIAKSLKRPEEMCKEMYAKSLDHSGDAEDSLDREHDPADLDLDAQSTTNRRLTWSPFWCVHSKSFQGNLKGHVPKSSDYQSAIPFLKYGQEVLFKGDAYAFQHNGWQCGTKLIGITDLGHGLSRQDYNKTLEAALSCVTEAPCVALTPASLCSFLGLTVHPSLAQRLARLVNTTPISGQLEPVRFARLLRWKREECIYILVLLTGNGKTKLVWEPERKVHHFARPLLVEFWDERGGRNRATDTHDPEVFGLIDFRLSGETLEVRIEWMGSSEATWHGSAEDLMCIWEAGGLGPYLDTEYTEHDLQPTPRRRLARHQFLPSREAVVCDRLPDWAVTGILQSLGGIG